MAYIKIADTEHGELGHNGWTWVLNHPYAQEDLDHQTYYEDAGILILAESQNEVEFRRHYGRSRSGLVRNTDIIIQITEEQAAAGKANRDAYDAIHKPASGYRVITD
jgi:hypothetical protein